MTCHGWNASSSPIMSEMRQNLEFVTRFLTLQLLKMLYSDVLLVGSNPEEFNFGCFWDQRLYTITFVPFNPYDVLVCILMWMEIMLWCIYYFPGVQPCDRVQVEVLSFSQEAAWLRLMEAIWYPSVLQKGGDEVTWNWWVLFRKYSQNYAALFFSVLK